MYVYQSFERGLWTVGFYRPNGKWEAESDHKSSEEAAERVAWLNGSSPYLPQSIQEALNSGDGSYHP